MPADTQAAALSSLAALSETMRHSKQQRGKFGRGAGVPADAAVSLIASPAASPGALPGCCSPGSLPPLLSALPLGSERGSERGSVLGSGSAATAAAAAARSSRHRRRSAAPASAAAAAASAAAGAASAEPSRPPAADNSPTPDPVALAGASPMPNKAPRCSANALHSRTFRHTLSVAGLLLRTLSRLVGWCKQAEGRPVQGEGLTPVAGHLTRAVSVQPGGVLGDQRAQLAGGAAHDLALKAPPHRQPLAFILTGAKQVRRQRVRIRQLRATRPLSHTN